MSERRHSDHSDSGDRFRVRPGAPKDRQQSLVTQVLRQSAKAGTGAIRKAGKQPGARLGRGHVAARFVASRWSRMPGVSPSRPGW